MSTVTAPTELLAIEKLREQELDEARVIQWAMLPSQTFHTDAVTISHEFQPVNEVGGDYLDYFNLSDGTVGLYIGDVSGKGLPAALYAALAVGTLRGVQKTGERPGRVLSVLNERLCLRGIPGRHSAIQYAVFDPVTAEMRIASAGMPWPLLIRDGQCSVLEVSGIPPGLFPGVAYEERLQQLQPGDTLVFCTDGVTEARNVQGEEFGVQGVLETCNLHWAEAPLNLLEGIFARLQTFTGDCRQWDDMAAAVFHYSPKGLCTPRC